MEQFQDTTATKKIFQLNKRIRAVAGGTSASKTISILIWCIDYGQSSDNEILTVVAESVPHLLLGAIRDFKNIMVSHGYWNENRWNESKHIYTFEGGSILEFISFDKFGKAHGPRRDILFLNEANNIPWLIADQLITRTKKIVWMDWNPSEEFWFYTEMLPNRTDIDFITLTYLDNEACDAITIAEIESHRNNVQWWRVYALGQLGEIETRVYRGWNIIEEIPFEAKLVRFGLDFGYTNDPTAIVGIYYYNEGYIADQVAFSKGLSNKMIADIISSQEQKALTVGDSAEPKSIDEISSYMIDIVGVSKRRGETKSDTWKKWSTGMVQQQRMSATRRSVNILKEYRNYLWMIDKNGKILNETEHQYSHSMNAIEYAIANLVGYDPKQDRNQQLEIRQKREEHRNEWAS